MLAAVVLAHGGGGGPAWMNPVVVMYGTVGLFVMGLMVIFWMSNRGERRPKGPAEIMSMEEAARRPRHNGATRPKTRTTPDRSGATGSSD